MDQKLSLLSFPAACITKNLMIDQHAQRLMEELKRRTLAVPHLS